MIDVALLDAANRSNAAFVAVKSGSASSRTGVGGSGNVVAGGIVVVVVVVVAVVGVVVAVGVVVVVVAVVVLVVVDGGIVVDGRVMSVCVVATGVGAEAVAGTGVKSFVCGVGGDDTVRETSPATGTATSVWPAPQLASNTIATTPSRSGCDGARPARRGRNAASCNVTRRWYCFAPEHFRQDQGHRRQCDLRFWLGMIQSLLACEPVA